MISPAGPLKLLQVTTVPQSFVFFRGQIGYLKKQGFEIHMVSSPDESADRSLEKEGALLHWVPMARSMAPARDLLALLRLWRLFRKIRPDIVHAHTPKAGLLGTLAARLAGVPVVFLSLFGLPQMAMQGRLRKFLDGTTRLACWAAQCVWCDSFSMRDYVIARGLCPPEKVVVFGQGSVNGVDAEDTFSPLRQGAEVRAAVRRRYAIPEAAPVLGYVGRMVGDKGLHELAQAWAGLGNRYPDLHLLLVGPFEEQDPLRPEDERLFRNDPRIHLTGPRQDVAALLAALDIFVMPSYREGFGITNIEAAALELPVVSTRIPGCLDSVQDGVTGTLVPPRDAPALAEAIERYLRDPDLRRRHGRAGRVRVLRDFRPETIWEALAREYRRRARPGSNPPEGQGA
ncbi:MAG: glycosyltransferase family 4 protein [Deltaproteobacteria bacterium]|nr:glycosyltransferase family 4 protein [Deltaproteobacteria bacterium]